MRQRVQAGLQNEIGQLGADHLLEPGGPPGLGDVVVQSGLVNGPDRVRLVRLAGDQHLARIRRALVVGHLHEHVDPAAPGQPVIGQDQGDNVTVGVDLVDDLEGVVDVLGRLYAHRIGEGGEIAQDGVADLGLVLDDDNGELHD